MYWIYFVSFHFCTKDIILILNHLLLEHRAHAIACCLLPTSILCLNEKQGRLFQYIWLFCTFLLTINSFHFFHLKSGAHEKLVNSIWMWGKDSNIQYRNINNERATYFGILIRNDQPQSSWPFGCCEVIVESSSVATIWMYFFFLWHKIRCWALIFFIEKHLSTDQTIIMEYIKFQFQPWFSVEFEISSTDISVCLNHLSSLIWWQCEKRFAWWEQIFAH